jgi:hypothetical protein
MSQNSTALEQAAKAFVAARVEPGGSTTTNAFYAELKTALYAELRRLFPKEPQNVISWVVEERIWSRYIDS